MPQPSAKTSDQIPALAVNGCRVEFGGIVALEGVSFTVEQGNLAAIIGPNGSGKTTLLKAILGLTPMVEGEALIFGKCLHAVRDLIGYVPQRFEFDRGFPITVREFLDLARHRHFPVSRVADKIREVGLPEKVLDQLLGELSGGQLQRVLIAQAIINDPPILFLDEPSSGIDLVGEKTLHGVLEHLKNEHKTTIIIVSHDISMVSHIVDTVICVNRKLMCYGPPRATLTERKITEVFGDKRSYYEHKGHYGHRHKKP